MNIQHTRLPAAALLLSLASVGCGVEEIAERWMTEVQFSLLDAPAG